MIKRTWTVGVVASLALTPACSGHGREQVATVDNGVAVRSAGSPVRTAHCPSGYIALTFDDGPSPITSRFIAFLSAHRIPATFFVVGSRMRYQAAVVQREQAAGFAIGNHTWSHADLTLLSSSRIVTEVEETANQFHRYGVRPTNLIRPPEGAIDERVKAVLNARELHVFQWTVDSEDWLRGDPIAIAHRVINGVAPGAPNVVLMHDGLSAPVSGRIASEQTIAAVPIIVEWARRHGYCFTAPGRLGWSTVDARVPWRTPVVPTSPQKVTGRRGMGGSGRRRDRTHEQSSREQLSSSPRTPRH